ncbi:MAG: FAD-binding oxidoreductase, partial [Rhodospirillaceae bacterium]|nr:FAD-binding oxidoreductase [Rhodospirillaceae bacterium]
MLNPTGAPAVAEIQTIEDARQSAQKETAPAWMDELRTLIASGQIHEDFDSRVTHSRDRLPFGRFRSRSEQLTGTLPSVVVEPKSIPEVQQVVRLAGRENISVIPYGSGSGVLGGTVPFAGEMILSCRHMNTIQVIDETNRIARADAGTNGLVLENTLREKGYTCGHYPQSLSMSTVGGWAACRGAGQASSRYGNIENLIVGMKVVLPDGELLEVRHAPRRSVGPSILEMFIGSEGVLGVIVEVTLRIWRLPEQEIDTVMAFPDLEHGLAAIRDIMQAELRPALARLYDEAESIKWGLEAPPGGVIPVITMLSFAGLYGVAEAEAEAAMKICEAHGGKISDREPMTQWQAKRFESHSDAFVDAGGYYETIEVAAPWSTVGAMYEQMKAAVNERHPVVQLSAHWSHAYSDGSCMYLTCKIPAMADDEALPIHADVWEIIMRICLDTGGTISHHHGIGCFRNRWIA